MHRPSLLDRFLPELGTAACLLAALVTDAAAQCGVARVTASVTDGVDLFGAALAVDGGRLAVGAPRADLDEFSGGFEGHVAIFDAVGGEWVESALVTDPLPSSFDEFGASVALSGDLLAVGAPGAESEFVADDGQVLLFEFDGADWVFRQRLILPAPTGLDRFGESLAWSAGRLLVGAPGNGLFGPASGAVFVYSESGGEFVPSGILIPTDAGPGQRFGSALAADGPRVAVGAPLAAGAQPFAGRAEVFEFDGAGFAALHTVDAPGLSAGAFLGSSVALAGDLLAVGAPGDTAGIGPGTGSAWIVDLGVPAPFATELNAFDAAPGEAFGRAVAVADGAVWVGRPRRAEGGRPAAGSVDRFAPTGAGWVQTARLDPPDDAVEPAFGRTLAVAAGQVLVAAPEEAVGSTFGELQAGAVYAHELELALAALSGCPETLSLFDGGRFELRARSGPAPTPALVLWLVGASGAEPATTVGGVELPLVPDGVTALALAGGLPLSAVLSGADALGEARAELDLAPGLDPALAGLVLTHAAVVLDPVTLVPTSAGGPAALTLLP